jgi:hypothetical protein
MEDRGWFDITLSISASSVSVLLALSVAFST